MFKSKIIYALSLSFLINVSYLPLVHAGKKDEEGRLEKNRNPRHNKAQKIGVNPTQNKRKMRKLKEAKAEIVKKLKDHNVEFPQPAQKWGIFPRNIWEVVGSHLPLNDFFKLFSCNRDFLDLGEQLIQKRPLPGPFPRNFCSSLINVPFKLPRQYQRRKFSISYLMRCDLSDDAFITLRDSLLIYPFLDIIPRDRATHMTRRADFYAPIDPLMAAYYELQVTDRNALYLTEDADKAKKKFLQLLKNKTRVQDPLALEMLICSQLVRGDYPLISDESDEYSFLLKAFPYPNQSEIKETVFRKAFEQSDDPDYLLNLCRFVLENENGFRMDEIEPSVCSVWKCVGIHLLNYEDEEKEFKKEPRHPAEDVYLFDRHFKDRESAFIYFESNKLFRAQQALLRYLARPKVLCPSMRVLESLVQNAKFKTNQEKTSFHPAYIDEVEGYLNRLLSFGERTEEYQTYLKVKFRHIHDNQAAIDADGSVSRVAAIKSFALENLLSLYLQKGDQDKAKEIAEVMTKDNG